MEHLFPYPKMGSSWLEILEDPLTRKLLGHDAQLAEKVPFIAGVQSRFKFLLKDPLKHLSFAKIGYSALEAFLQANCTGPPLDFDSMPVIVPEQYRAETAQIKEAMVKSLSIDGIDIYPLTPRVELFWLAKTMMDNTLLAEEGFNGRRARFRINFWHQKLLSEVSDSLKGLITHDANVLDTQMTSRLTYGGAAAQEHMVEFLVERATVRIYYGNGALAREDLLRAARLREFEFALTGALGKRTKFQEKDITQLVVMAKSRDFEPEPYSSRKSSRAEQGGSRKSSLTDKLSRNSSLRPMTPGSIDFGQHMFSSMAGFHSPKTTTSQPENIALNHDTLLEQIQFKRMQLNQPDPTTDIITEQSHLPINLAFMDPNDQPILFPMDSIILLAIASSITTNQAADGLTREETLPYATRVLEGGSSNWSVYSQALLIRSRIEGHIVKTAERGLLQLQALVDQVIMETTKSKSTTAESVTIESNGSSPATFLPKTEEDERTTVAERLKFVHQISPSFRWELEAELASRWTSMGGLKSALDIYERLQMHAEVALCLAATDQEAQAIALLRKILFADPGQAMKDGDVVKLKEPPPTDTPRLLCVLGDLESEPKFYNLAWTLSSQRYARAQRSLGKFYTKKNDPEAAARAYTQAVRIARQDLGTWFALGCVQFELQDWKGAVGSFSRVVQLEDGDAQGWSNLAVALLRLPAPVSSPVIEMTEPTTLQTIEENVVSGGENVDPLKHTREALVALRRAAHLKRDDARIWDNYLTVAASIPPNPEHPEKGTPWQEVVNALSQIIFLRHKKEGESCIDVKIFEAVVDHVTNTWEYPTTETELDNDTAKRSKEQPDTPESIASSDVTSIASPDPSRKSLAEERSTTPDQVAHPSSTSASARIPFLVKAVLRMIDTQIAHLVTTSPQLFLLLSRVALWRHRPAESLADIERYWRATTNAPNANEHPSDLVEATTTLVNAYQTLGPMERERTGGTVEKGWKFKSRSAIRSVIGKAKGVWDDEEEFKELETLMEQLKTEDND